MSMVRQLDEDHQIFTNLGTNQNLNQSFFAHWTKADKEEIKDRQICRLQNDPIFRVNSEFCQAKRSECVENICRQS